MMDRSNTPWINIQPDVFDPGSNDQEIMVCEYNVIKSSIGHVSKRHMGMGSERIGVKF